MNEKDEKNKLTAKGSIAASIAGKWTNTVSVPKFVEILIKKKNKNIYIFLYQSKSIYQSNYMYLQLRVK